MSSSLGSLLGMIADEYTDRLRRGETPTPAEYRERYPEAADLLGEILPLLEAMRPRADTPAPAAERPIEPAPVAPPGYEIARELGRGGMGVVYEARQTAAARAVALKMILAGEYADAEDVRRFRGEIEAVARLRHPGVVQVYEVGEHGGRAFFSMEFCPGGGLDRKLGGTPLGPREAARLTADIAAAVEAVHACGVVHRDLKPANVLLDGDGRPKVADFGLARRTDLPGATRTGSIVGTPSYMPPEQARGERDVTAAADVYSLGAILYECLTGRPPFRASGVLDTVLQVIDRDPAPVRDLNPVVPADLATICHMCLRKEPGRRYASAGDLAVDLRRWLTGEPIRARPVGSFERVVKWCARHPLPASLMALTAAVIITAFAVVLAYYDEAKHQAGIADEKRGLAEVEGVAARVAEGKARVEATRADREAKRAVERYELSRTAKYAALLGTARSELLSGKTATALDALTRCDWDRRGPEFGHVSRLVPLPTFEDVGAPIDAAALSPDGSVVAYGSLNRKLRIREYPSGLLLTPPASQTWQLNDAVFSPDGATLVAATNGYDLPAWDARTGAKKWAARGHRSAPRCVCFSGDGNRIVSAANDGVRVRSAEKGAVVHSFKSAVETPMSLTTNRDGSRVCVVGLDGENTKTAVVHSAEGKELFRPDTPGREPTCAAYLASGDLVVGTDGGGLFVYAGDTGRMTRVLTGHRAAVTCAAAAGAVVASGSADGSVAWHDVATGATRLTRGHTAAVTRVSISADGSRIASGSKDRTVRVFDRAEAEPFVTRRAHAGGVTCLAASGGVLLTASKDTVERKGVTVRAWDERARRSSVFAECRSAITSLALDGAGERAAVGDSRGAVVLRDARTRRELWRDTAATKAVAGLAFSADGAKVFAAGEKSLRVLDGATGKALSSVALPETVYAVARRPGSDLVAVGMNKGAALVDAAAGQIVRVLARNRLPVRAVAFRPDGGRLAAGSNDGTVRVYDVTTGDLVYERYGSTGFVNAVAFSPDGSRLVYAQRGRVTVLEADSGVELLTHADYPSAVQALHLAAGGRLVTGHDDGAIRVREAAPTDDFRDLTANDRGFPKIHPPEGGILTAVSFEGTICRWDLRTGATLGEDRNGGRLVVDARGGALLEKDGDAVFRAADGSSRRAAANGARLSALRPDGKAVLRVAKDGTFSEADGTGDPRPLAAEKMPDAALLAYAPGGAVFAAADGLGNVRVHEAASGKLVAKIAVATKAVSLLALSADGARLATLAGDKLVRVHGVASGRVEAELKGHGDATDLTFDPACSRLAICGGIKANARTLRVFAVPGGRELMPAFREHNGIRAAAFVDATTVAASSYHVIHLFRVPER